MKSPARKVARYAFVLCLLLPSLGVVLIPPAALGGPDHPTAILYGPAGEMLAAPSVSTPPLTGGRDAGEFQPNVRVDDDINPEHREPVAVWGPAGEIYVAYCERASHANPELVMFTRSTDLGAIWLDPAIRVNDTAPNAVVFPAIGLLEDGAIVLVWNELKFAPYNYEIRFSRSTDGGTTWSASSVVHPINPAVDYFRPSLLVAGGRILVSYWEEVSYPNGRPTVVYSDDGGTTWSAPVTVSTTLARYDAAAPCLAHNTERGTIGLVSAPPNQRILFYQSTDAGANWSAGVQVNDAAATSANYADLACGEGFDYVVWTDNRNGQYDTDIWISRSADGTTFSPNVKVNDAFQGNQYEPHIRFDPLGQVHVCWIWNMPFQGNIDLYYSVSADGGATWHWPTPRVNDVPYTVQPYVAWTSDLLADDGGHAFLFWNDGRTSHYYDNIYTSTNLPAAGVDGDGIGPFEDAAILSGRGSMRVTGQPGGDPMLRLRLWEPIEDLRIDLVDLQGRIVRPITAGRFGTGDYRFPLARSDGGRWLAQGGYLVRLVSEGETAARRFLLVR